MKKSIPKVRERESEASILGNDREREFPLTPANRQVQQLVQMAAEQVCFAARFLSRGAIPCLNLAQAGQWLPDCSPS